MQNVIQAFKGWRAAEGGDRDEFLASLDEHRATWAEAYSITGEDVAQFKETIAMVEEGLEREQQYREGTALRPGASLAEIAHFGVLQEERGRRWARETAQMLLNIRRGKGTPGAGQGNRRAESGVDLAEPDLGLREVFDMHYHAGGSLRSFAALTPADLSQIGVEGSMPEVATLAEWAAEYDWREGGDMGGTWADLSDAQRGELATAYLEGDR